MQEGWVQFQVCVVVHLLSVSCFSSWAFTLPPSFSPDLFFSLIPSTSKVSSVPTHSSKFPSPFRSVYSHPVLSFPQSLLFILQTSSSAICLAHNLTSSLCTPSSSWDSSSHSLCAFLAPLSNFGPFYYLTIFFSEDDKRHIPIHSIICERELSNHNGGHCYQ